MAIPFKITVELASGEVFTSSGKSVEEALSKINLDYTQVKTKGTITLEHGKEKSTKFYYLRPLRRIVANKLRKVQVGKDLAFLLK